MADEPLVTKLARALLWKMHHAGQHSSQLDDALLDYLEALGPDAPADIEADVYATIGTRSEPPEPPAPTGPSQGTLLG